MDKTLLLNEAFLSVKEQQEAFISVIFPQDNGKALPKTTFDERGLAVYRRNLQATARRALAISFPTVLQLIGNDFFNYSCHQLLICSPPNTGDWGMWGNDFSELLSRLPELADYPFLSDIAKLDFLQHHSMRAKNQNVDMDSLQLLATVELDNLYCVLAQSCFALTSTYPIIELWQAHQEGKSTIDGAGIVLSKQYLEQIKIKLADANFIQHILIFRPEYKAHVEEISDAESFWLNKLNLGLSIGNVLDLMEDMEFDFAQWLVKAIEKKTN